MREDVEKREDLVVTRVPYFIPGVQGIINFLGEPAHILAVQDKATMALKQIILLSYHGEWLFYANGSHHTEARMMDATWNTCAALAGLNTVNAGYFEWKVTATQKKKGSTPAMVQRAIYLVKMEKHGEPVNEERVREEFSGWIRKNSKAFDSAKGSVAKRILDVMRAKGHETQAASGWQALARARESQGASRLENLAKARAKEAVAGFPHLAAMRELQALRGWPSLARGRETQAKAREIKADAKWQAIKEGPLLVWERRDRNRAKEFHELEGKPWRERSKWMSKQAYALAQYGAKIPGGFRYEGDGKGGNAKEDVEDVEDAEKVKKADEAKADESKADEAADEAEEAEEAEKVETEKVEKGGKGGKRGGSGGDGAKPTGLQNWLVR